MESTQMEQFREAVKDLLEPELLNDEKYLWRWLQARDYNIEKAKSMLVEHLQWRVVHKVDTILSDYEAQPIFQTYYIGGVCGFDKDGCPVWVEPMPKLDAKGLLHSVTKHDILRFKIYTVERMLKMCEEQSRKLGKPVDQVVVLFDMEALAWKHLWKPGIDLLRMVLEMFEANYPERLLRCYVIHAPKLFQIGYNMVEPALSKRTKEKVQILGGDWRQKIQQTIPADQLSVHHGGTQMGENGDEYLLHKVMYGGEIPKSFYMDNIAPEDTMTKTVIHRRSDFLHTMELPVGCTLKWRFCTEAHDISFGLYLKSSLENSKNRGEPVIPLSRVNSHFVHEVGEVLCKKSGHYVFHFDNSYSWTRSKTLHYSMEVLPPGSPLPERSTGESE